jgi:hypothetical protein
VPHLVVVPAALRPSPRSPRTCLRSRRAPVSSR